MPYTNTPSNDTYSSKELPLMHDLALLPSAGYTSGGLYADGLKTRLLAGATNVLPYKSEDGNTIYGETRGALQATTVTAGNLTIARGYFIWNRSLGVEASGAVGDETYEILVTNDTSAGSKLWWRLGVAGSWTTFTLTQTKNTVVRFAEFIDATAGKKLCMSDGIDLYVITAAAHVLTVTRCTDADMPTPHIPFPVFLDGYIFLAKEGTGDIYNSDLNNPLSWTAGNFISAEMYPDDIQALVRINNFILALGASSGEYFYDAGNASGSPLQRQENAALPFGTEIPDSIAYTKEMAMFIATDARGEYSFQVVRGFKHEPFPGDAVLEVLQAQLAGGNTVQNAVRSGFLRQHNKLFYFLAFNGLQADSSWNNDTVMASLDCQMWVRTVSDQYNGGTPAGQYGFPVLFAHHMGVSNDGATHVAGHFSVTGGAFVGTMTPTRFVDQLDAFNLYNIYQKMTIPPERFGTWNRKFMSRAAVDYVVQPALDVGAGGLGIQLRYSDDLTGTWNTAFPSGSVNNNFPFFLQLGQFRQRMFEVVALSQRMRYHNLEVDINKGQQ